MPQANWSSQAKLELEEVAFYIAMRDGRRDYDKLF
jgi:hypothetical protein